MISTIYTYTQIGSKKIKMNTYTSSLLPSNTSIEEYAPKKTERMG